MRNPVMPPFLALAGIALIFYGCRRLLASFRKPDAEFRVGPRSRPGRVEARLVRTSGALDSISFVFVGVVVFAFGVIYLMDFF